ncbi:MAG: hypothetical protein ABI557_05225 [Aureliella sp.]
MSQEHLQQLMMIAGLGLICWLLMRGKMRRRKPLQLPTTFSLGHNCNAQASVAPFSGTKSLGAPAEVLRWQVELHDLARELKAELDSKLIAVRAMTNSYDQATRRLAEMIRLAEQVQCPPTSPLAEVRHLSALGWESAKIAQTLSLNETDVSQLLALDFEKI